MYHIKNDQRSIRSSEMLYAGLAKLMREKEFVDITVTDLVEAANVGRTTFYRNFDEIEDILHLRNDQVFEGLRKYVGEYRERNRSGARSELLKPMLRYFYLNSEIIELLMKANRIDIFQDSFRKLLEPFKPLLRSIHDVEEVYIEYLIAINKGVLTNILTYWIKSGKAQAPDDLADNINILITNDISPWTSI
jgi:AcrR family transcriptional regulator